MRPCVTLDDIVEGMQWQSVGMAAYLNTKTGQVVPVGEDELAAAALGDDSRALSDWEAEAIGVARAVLEGRDYVALPDRFEIDEYRMMQRFAASAGEAAREHLLEGTRGPGAFRYFKGAVEELGIAREWYSFRDRAYEQIAADWCRGNEIEYTRSTRSIDGPDD